jgi:hypothetical protein
MTVQRLHMTQTFHLTMKIDVSVRLGEDETQNRIRIAKAQNDQHAKLRMLIQRFILELGQCPDCQYGVRHSVCPTPIYATYRTSEEDTRTLQQRVDTSLEQRDDGMPYANPYPGEAI